MEKHWIIIILARFFTAGLFRDWDVLKHIVNLKGRCCVGAAELIAFTAIIWLWVVSLPFFPENFMELVS